VEDQRALDHVEQLAAVGVLWQFAVDDGAQADVVAGLLGRGRVRVFGAATAATAATAAPPADRGPKEPATREEACMDTAADVGAEGWVCFGGVVNYVTAEVDGTRSVQKQARVPGFRQLDEKASGTEPGGVSTLGYTDPSAMDGGCENYKECHTHPFNEYSGRTKGNAWYGWNGQTVARWDVVVTLNGRQPRYDVVFDWDPGAALTFTSTYITCWKDQVVDAKCNSSSSYPLGGNDASFYISSTATRMIEPRIYDPKLTQSDEYYSVVSGVVDPAGSTYYAIRMDPPLVTDRFNCYGTTARCYYPNSGW